MKLLTRLRKEAPTAEGKLRDNLKTILGPIPTKRIDLLNHHSLDFSSIPRIGVNKRGQLPLPAGAVIESLLDEMEREGVIVIKKHPPHYHPMQDTITLKGVTAKLFLVRAVSE